jgi:hypothetical protein
MAQRVREGEGEVLQRIAEAERSGVSDLDLSAAGLTAIPGSLSRLTNLQLLNVFGNPLPDEVLAAAERGPEALFR